MSPPKNPATLINVADIVEENGKTIRDNNLEKVHSIPIGTLVEVKYDEWHDGGACEKVHARLYVVSHDRDCDGTPLYSLSPYKEPLFVEGSLKFRDPDGWWIKEETVLKMANRIIFGFSEGKLTPIEVTQDLKDGVGALLWDEK